MTSKRLNGRPTEALILLFIIVAPIWFWQPRQSPQDSKSLKPASKGIAFDVSLHADYHAFTSAQCSAAFPDLYKPITAALRRRGGKPIKAQDIEIAQGRCMLRVMVNDNEVFVVDSGNLDACYIAGNRERAVALLSIIHRAVTSAPEGERVPNAEFTITFDDIPLRSKTDSVMLAFTRQDSEEYKDVWVIPDYAYWSWHFTKIASYQRLRKLLHQMDETVSFQGKKNKAVWRGKLNASPIRGKLMEVAEGKSWNDIADMDIAAQYANPDADMSRALTFEEMCQNKFVIHTEGTTYSGRLKFLQACKSVIITHPLQWEEFHSHLLVSSGANQNFIQVSDDWSELDREINRLIEHPSEAEAIASRSHKVFGGQYLTPAAISCYWRQLLHEWASLQDFEPQLYETKDGKRVTRAVPYSDFLVA